MAMTSSASSKRAALRSKLLDRESPAAEPPMLAFTFTLGRREPARADGGRGERRPLPKPPTGGAGAGAGVAVGVATAGGTLVASPLPAAIAACTLASMAASPSSHALTLRIAARQSKSSSAAAARFASSRTWRSCRRAVTYVWTAARRSLIRVRDLCARSTSLSWSERASRTIW